MPPIIPSAGVLAIRSSSCAVDDAGRRSPAGRTRRTCRRRRGRRRSPVPSAARPSGAVRHGIRAGRVRARARGGAAPRRGPVRIASRSTVCVDDGNRRAIDSTSSIATQRMVRRDRVADAGRTPRARCHRWRPSRRGASSCSRARTSGLAPTHDGLPSAIDTDGPPCPASATRPARSSLGRRRPCSSVLPRAILARMTTKFTLDESEIPRAWLNIVPALPSPPPPALHPGTLQPAGPDDFAPLFPMDLILQEVSQESYIEIPEPVLDVYRLWRPTPLFRAHRLEKALGTPAHIYYKYEGTSPAGSHKPNTAVPQAYYNAKAGVKKLTTETGRRAVGHGARLRLRAVRPRVRGLAGACVLRREAVPPADDGDVRRHRAPARRPISPTRAGRSSPSTPTPPARSASRSARPSRSRHRDPNIRYALGSVLNHVLMHQTVIGLEALKQFELAGEYPDVIYGCVGGGSNFGGLTFPFLNENLAGRRNTAHRRRRAGRLPEHDQGRVRLRLRRHRRDDAADEDAHARQGLHPRHHPRRRPALPRDEPAGVAHLRARPDRGRIEEPARLLRCRRAVRPHRGHRAGAGAHPRARRVRRGGAALQGERRAEGDPHRAVRPRHARSAGVRELPRPASSSTTTTPPRPSRPPSPACPRSEPAKRAHPRSEPAPLRRGGGGPARRRPGR